MTWIQLESDSDHRAGEQVLSSLINLQHGKHSEQNNVKGL
jgi:hypothetical protein